MRRRPYEMTELMYWLEENRPELAARIGPMKFWEGAQVLMKETGVTVTPSDFVDKGCEEFLNALKAQTKLAG